VIATLVGVITSALVLSDFGKSWADVGESYLSYFDYTQRGAGSGHEKPFWYYAKLFTWNKDGYVWGELLTVFAAIYGAMFAWVPGLRHFYGSQGSLFLRWISLIAVILFLLYSLIPYKTPWSILSVQFLLILLGGAGLTALICPLRKGGYRWAQLVLTLATVYGLYHYGLQNQRASGRMASDPRNPMVYGHSSWQVKELAEGLQQLQKQRSDFSVQVYQAEYGWPLPWYLRDNKRVGFSGAIPSDSISADAVIYAAEWKDEIEPLLPPGHGSILKALRPDSFVYLSMSAEARSKMQELSK